MVKRKKTEVLEGGQVYFLYRPKIGEFAPGGLEDVQRFYMVLKPEDETLYRLIVVSQKKLPEADPEREKYWGYVEMLVHSPEEVEKEFEGRVYSTKTVGERGQPSGRPVGEGVYKLVSHDSHTHLIYALVTPQELGEVQQELGLKKEGNFIVSMINPKVSPPSEVEFPKEERANYPQELQRIFGKRRFQSLNTPEFLDFRGAAFILIGVEKDVSSELGISLEPEIEDQDTGKVFEDLKLERSTHRIEPLFGGRWA